jgi:Spy/CpxP family protein refolding chaperone
LSAPTGHWSSTVGALEHITVTVTAINLPNDLAGRIPERVSIGRSILNLRITEVSVRFLILGLSFVCASVLAQHAPYAGQQERQIKALSNDDIKQYQDGAGMSYALAAELNHYPGPLHTLEFADELKLSAQQRSALKTLMDSHKAEARDIGARLVTAERTLDESFRSERLDAADLRAKVHAAGALQSEYRLAHLETHRRTRDLLTPEQVARYDSLRGYGATGSQSDHRGHK